MAQKRFMLSATEEIEKELEKEHKRRL